MEKENGMGTRRMFFLRRPQANMPVVNSCYNEYNSITLSVFLLCVSYLVAKNGKDIREMQSMRGKEPRKDIMAT